MCVVLQIRRVFEVQRTRRAVSVGRATISLARSEQITFLAAAIAYYAFASIVPLVVLTAVVASVVGGEAFARNLVESLGETLTPASQDVLLSTLTTTSGRGSATLIGAIALVWSSLKVFRALDTAFSIVYGEPANASFFETVVDGAVALAAVGFAIGASAALVAALTFFDVPFLGELGFVVEVFVLAAAFYPLYYLFPGVEVSYREALPGAITAAVGWSTLSGLFGLYAENAASFALWGALGVALVIVTWLYVGSLLLLVGAALNAVLADRPLSEVESDVSVAMDRHLQSVGLRQVQPEMGEDDRDGSRDNATPGDADVRDPTTDADSSDADATDDADAEDAAALRAEVEKLRAELESFEDDVEDRTLHRKEVEGDLKRYVRRRMRRGRARGWGPYLVLLYGTVMTLGAFYTPFLTGGWAIFAMIVIWLSTLGLYVLMVLVGVSVNVLGVPGRVRDAIGEWRS